MGTVTGLTSERMLAIEAASIVNGTVNSSGDLVLTTEGGTAITAGHVAGPQGIQGNPGVPGSVGPIPVIFAPSVSTLPFAVGSVSIVTGTPLNLVVGDTVTMTDSVSSHNAYGVITAISGNNVTVSVTSFDVSMTSTAFTIHLSGHTGPTGGVGPTGPAGLGASIHAHTNAPQTVATATPTAIVTGWVEDTSTETGLSFATSTGIITCVTAGTYRFQCVIEWAPSSNSTRYLFLRNAIGSGAFAYNSGLGAADFFNTPSATVNCTQKVDVTLVMAVGDRVQVWGQQSVGSSINETFASIHATRLA